MYRHWSKSHNRHFYYNANTKTTTWIKDDMMHSKSDSLSAAADNASANKHNVNMPDAESKGAPAAGNAVESAGSVVLGVRTATPAWLLLHGSYLCQMTLELLEMHEMTNEVATAASTVWASAGGGGRVAQVWDMQGRDTSIDLTHTVDLQVVVVVDLQTSQ